MSMYATTLGDTDGSGYDDGIAEYLRDQFSDIADAHGVSVPWEVLTALAAEAAGLLQDYDGWLDSEASRVRRYRGQGGPSGPPTLSLVPNNAKRD